MYAHQTPRRLLPVESRHRHHPGYQTITSNSWWCDDCLKQCHAIPALDPVPAGHWSDFFVWLSQLLLNGYGAALSGIFGLIMFIIGDNRWYRTAAGKYVDSALVHEWKMQEKWLLVERHRLLIAIDRKRGHRAQAYYDNHWATLGGPDIEQMSIDRLQAHLDQTMTKLEAVEKKLHSIRAAPAPPAHHEYLVIGQENQHAGH